MRVQCKTAAACKVPGVRLTITVCSITTENYDQSAIRHAQQPQRCATDGNCFTSPYN